MKKPLVSVVMAVYNGQEFINLAIDSLLLQTYSNFELLIIDDGSTDDTPHIVAAYTDKRIKYQRRRNQGQAAALNAGISIARGKYIARMDADDLSYPERLAAQVLLLDNNPDIGLVGTGFDLIDQNSAIIGHSYHLDRSDDIHKEFLVRNPFGHGTIMVRKAVLEDVGAYDITQPIEDYELWWRIARNYKTANIPDMLYAWRVLPTGISKGGSAKRQKPITELMEVIWSTARPPKLSRASLGSGLDYYARLGPGYRDQYLAMECALALGLLKTGQRAAALNNFLRLLAVRGSINKFRAFKNDPFSYGYNLGIIKKFPANII